MAGGFSSGLLDADAVSNGEALGVFARNVVEGYRVGEHRSPYHGFAIEFSQHREYSPGDDLRHLDWKVLGRTDRYFIKQYEQDTNFISHLFLDGSESMNYASGKLPKLAYAKALAACLAYIILLQRDAVALEIFDEREREYLPRTDSPGKIHHIMERLAAFTAESGTRLGAGLSDLARRVKARGIVVVFSDLFDDEEEFRRGVEQIRFGGSEVIVFHILDPEEMEFSFRGSVEFVGLEGLGILKTDPSALRKSYRETIRAFCVRMREICDRTGSHYVPVNTAHSLAETLSAYLVFRKELAGGRK
jgi:uncharacterized protein (DUF58 family)